MALTKEEQKRRKEARLAKYEVEARAFPYGELDAERPGYRVELHLPARNRSRLDVTIRGQLPAATERGPGWFTGAIFLGDDVQALAEFISALIKRYNTYVAEMNAAIAQPVEKLEQANFGEVQS